VYLYMDRLQTWLLSHLRGDRRRSRKQTKVPAFSD
jgi:hypothetical protein